MDSAQGSELELNGAARKALGGSKLITAMQVA
jgi:hypothetical protein